MQAESQFVFRLQTVGGFGGKSDQLNAYNMFLAIPATSTVISQRYLSVTPASVSEALGRTCDRPVRHPQRRPAGRADLAMPDSLPAAVA